MNKLTPHKIINVLNNDDGNICEEIYSDEIEFYSTYLVGDIVDFGIPARITKVEHYPMTNPSYGMVTYKLLGRVVIERL